MVRQDENGFKHVALLRKVIREKRSGTAWFAGDGWNREIAFSRGITSADAIGGLAHILQQPVYRLDWDKTAPQTGPALERMPVRHVFAHAIAALDMPVQRMISYRKTLERLPNVRIRYLATFRSDADYQRHFQMLYRMSLESSGVHLEDYFASATDISELRMRVNIVIGAYCLGDLLPAAQAAGSARPAEDDRDPGTISVVTRVLTLLRESMNG